MLKTKRKVLDASQFFLFGFYVIYVTKFVDFYGNKVYTDRAIKYL